MSAAPIQERLRTADPQGSAWSTVPGDLISEAAATIDRLNARIAELEKALEPVRNLPVECVDALHPAYQRQLDMDGVEVGVSRQAIDEIHAALIEARATLEASERGDA